GDRSEPDERPTRGRIASSTCGAYEPREERPEPECEQDGKPGRKRAEIPVPLGRQRSPGAGAVPELVAELVHRVRRRRKQDEATPRQAAPERGVHGTSLARLALWSLARRWLERDDRAAAGVRIDDVDQVVLPVGACDPQGHPGPSPEPE